MFVKSAAPRPGARSKRSRADQRKHVEPLPIGFVEATKPIDLPLQGEVLWGLTSRDGLALLHRDGVPSVGRHSVAQSGAGEHPRAPGAFIEQNGTKASTAGVRHGDSKAVSLRRPGVGLLSADIRAQCKHQSHAETYTVHCAKHVGHLARMGPRNARGSRRAKLL